jgi:archaellum component FlaC
MGKIRDWLFGKKPPPILDVVAMHETRTAGMCTLTPQVNAWRNWLAAHSQQVQQEQEGISSDIERLETTKRGLERLKGLITKHRKILLDTHETGRGLLDSFSQEPDPDAEDTIGLHAKVLTELQRSQKESITNVLLVVREEIGSMTSRHESVETELKGVTEKLERLSKAKETLDSEKEITEAFEKNIAAFMASISAPPKSE